MHSLNSHCQCLEACVYLNSNIDWMASQNALYPVEQALYKLQLFLLVAHAGFNDLETVYTTFIWYISSYHPNTSKHIVI